MAMAMAMAMIIKHLLKLFKFVKVDIHKI
jgi:hypothetical protein